VATVGLVVHHARPIARGLAEEAGAWLEERGHEVRVGKPDAEATGLDRWAVPPEAFVAGLDLAVSLGGDGTILRTVGLVVAQEVPILGVNIGHLGYLTEVEPAGLLPALERFVSDAYSIEERLTLAVDVDVRSSATEPGRETALNEAVIEKTAPGHTVRLDVTLNGAPFTSYAADGLIVATPTGSTAYSLSARGPIVSPRHRALLLTPVAPHMLFDRALVLDAEDVIELRVKGREATLSIDGRPVCELDDGDGVVCTAGPHAARFVSFGGRDFHQILKTKFGLADR
jgi:NAD+ kinase